MDGQRKKQTMTSKSSCFDDDEVTSREWEFINMTEQEEDLIYRLHNLVGDKWELIAGRIPGRKAEEIERFWLMKHDNTFATRRQQEQLKHRTSRNIF